METWNHIINTALLGTGKGTIKKENLDPEIAEHFDTVSNAGDNEEVFLQTASLVYNFRQCGFKPLDKKDISIPAAADEEKNYAGEFAHRILHDILEISSNSLFYFWLKHCDNARKIVQPEMVPVLLDQGMKNKSIRSLVYDCCGKRGSWLLQFNPAWKYVDTSTDEELWQTGTLEQRKNVLRSIRKTDPAKARELLQQVWQQENAATKVELLQELEINAGQNDLSFLEETLNDKSIKVKDAGIELLKKIPSSSIVQLFWQTLQPSIQVKKEKTLLGLSNKMVLDFLPVENADELIFKRGIEKLSSNKKIQDADFLVWQLIAAIPPSHLEQSTGLKIEEIIRLLQNSPRSKYFVSALGMASIQFSDITCLSFITALPNLPFYPEALNLLPQKEAEQYAIANLETDNAYPIIQALIEFEKEWSIELAGAVLQVTSKNPYQYNRGFYSEIIHLLPYKMVTGLENYGPKEEHLVSTWNNAKDHIIKLLELKQQTIKAFKE